VAAAVAPSGPVRAALAVEPLRQLGRISYGVYLFHWPIFLWLTEARTGWSQVPLFGLRVSVTLAVAIVSFVLVEQPIRKRQLLAVDRQALMVAPAAAVVLVVALGAVTVDIPGPPIDFATASAEAEQLIDGEGDPATGCLGIEPAASEGPAPSLNVAGDSTALMMNIGLATWGRCTGLIRSVGATHAFGCGVGTGGSKFFRGADREMVGSWKGDPVPDGTCREWRDQFGEAFDGADADAIVVEFGPPDLTDRRLEGSDETVRLGDPVYDDYLRGAMDEFVSEVSEFAPQVIWLLSPPERPLVDGSPPVPPYPESDPARTAAYNDLIRELPDRHPQVTVIDLGPWFEELPDGV
ncbi:MAG: acyltransferase family protein, partial [Actinomycetota bacterium]